MEQRAPTGRLRKVLDWLIYPRSHHFLHGLVLFLSWAAGIIIIGLLSMYFSIPEYFAMIALFALWSIILVIGVTAFYRTRFIVNIVKYVTCVFVLSVIYYVEGSLLKSNLISGILMLVLFPFYALYWAKIGEKVDTYRPPH